MLSFCCLFFFSSRRRHTRLVSDWSSDVCSSDLGRERGRHRDLRARSGAARTEHDRLLGDHELPRSEEHTSELQSLTNLVCRLLLEKKNAWSGTMLTGTVRVRYFAKRTRYMC